MSKSNNTTKKNENQYHHLTRDDRNKIESLINQVDDNGKRIHQEFLVKTLKNIYK